MVLVLIFKKSCLHRGCFSDVKYHWSSFQFQRPWPPYDVMSQLGRGK